MKNLDELFISTLRLLSADAIQKANSGHPGLPLGAAPAAYALYGKLMKYNPKNPDWPDRDRFILSAGHGSALLYSILHVFGFDLTIEDLKNFRQLGSKTPGHPEYKHTPGVEITTGPLGQGIANAVGMAMAEAHLASVFNRPTLPIVDHYTYVLCGDGCLMEGISSEACSLAGTLELNKLILLYDSNNITIEGDTAITFKENVLKRYEAYGWHTQLVEDGNDLEAIINAVEQAKAETKKPSIIEIKTKIGYGSPNKVGKASAHGEPLGVDEIKLVKKALGFDPENHFHVPDEVKKQAEIYANELNEKESKWHQMVSWYAKSFPDDYCKWQEYLNLDIPYLLDDVNFWEYEGDIATRVSSEIVLNKLAPIVPNLIGGSADLAPSTKTIMKNMGDFSAEDYSGRNIHFGIREHAMTAIANGIAAHGGLRAYVSGFFVFSDYMKPAMRLSSLMKLPVINIMTHDSIGVGEDGPTHEPIEHLAALRSIPNHTVIRPCDTKETAVAWYLALTRNSTPTTIVLSRQNLKLLPETGKAALKGGYILKDSKKPVPDIILIATGSEVELISKAHEELQSKGIDARAVSLMSFEVFEEQSEEYKESVLPMGVKKRLAVEAASSFGWAKYIGFDGDMISIDTFGASAPASALFKQFGFTVENVVERSLKLLS